MHTFLFGDEMGYTVGPLVVSMLQSYQVDAAHCVTHPVTGASRITLYTQGDRTQATDLLVRALTDVRSKVQQCSDELSKPSVLAPRRSARVRREKNA